MQEADSQSGTAINNPTVTGMSAEQIEIAMRLEFMWISWYHRSNSVIASMAAPGVHASSAATNAFLFSSFEKNPWRISKP
jgi:hypothetical protein